MKFNNNDKKKYRSNKAIISKKNKEIYIYLEYIK